MTTTFDPTRPAPTFERYAAIIAEAIAASPAGVIRESDIPLRDGLTRKTLANNYVVGLAEHRHGITRTKGDTGRFGRKPVWHRLGADAARVAELQQRPKKAAKSAHPAPPATREPAARAEYRGPDERFRALFATRPADYTHEMYEAFVGAIKAAVEAGAIAEPDLVLPANLSRDLLTNPYMLNAARGLDLYRMNGSDDGSLPAVWFNAGCTAWDEDENDDPEACTWHHVKVVQAVADIIAQIPRSSLRGPA